MAGATGRAIQRDIRSGEGPGTGERIVQYSIFLTDAFENNRVDITFLDSSAIPTEIDGFENDDSYRQSRHLLFNKGWQGEERIANNLRENSLARQIATKEDQPATIRLVRKLRKAEFDETKARRPWQNLIPPNTKFFLENVQENRQEKVQIVDTFGEWVAFFFGNRPEVYTYSGTLLNSSNHDWKNEFQENYDNFLRGSQAVQNRATMLLQYDDVLVEGYMMGCSIAQSAHANHSVAFNFSLLVINRSPINQRLITYLRYKRSSVTEAEALLYRNMQSALELTTDAKGNVDLDRTETFLIMREFFSGSYTLGADAVNHRPLLGKIEPTIPLRPGQEGGTSSYKDNYQVPNMSLREAMLQDGITLDLPESTGLPALFVGEVPDAGGDLE